MDFISEDMKLAVKRGSIWMDETYPGWAQGITLDKLKMISCENCIIGQTIQNYYNLDPTLVGDWAVDHGFNTEGLSPEFRKLETLWTEEVKKRLG